MKQINKSTNKLLYPQQNGLQRLPIILIVLIDIIVMVPFLSIDSGSLFGLGELVLLLLI